MVAIIVSEEKREGGRNPGTDNMLTSFWGQFF